MELVSDDEYFEAKYDFPTHRLRWGNVRSLSATMPDTASRHALERVANNAVFLRHTHRCSLLDLFARTWQVDQLGKQSPQPRTWRSIFSLTGWIRFRVDEPSPAKRQKAEKVARNAD
jgi:hypothetical protein